MRPAKEMLITSDRDAEMSKILVGTERIMVQVIIEKSHGGRFLWNRN